MSRAADALQKSADRSRRAELANQFDIADIDTQFQRRRGDQHAQFAAFQALLGIEPKLAREAAVVRRDRVLAEPVGQMARGALGHAPRVDEHERRAMLRDEFGQPVVDALPRVVRHDRFERHRRQFERQVARADVPDIDDLARLRFSHQKLRHEFDRLLRRGQTDAHRPLGAQRVEAFEAQREMRAALGAGDGVNLVDDHGACRGQHRAAGIRTQQHVERFRRRDEDMRRALAHGGAFLLRGVAGAHGGADVERRQPQLREFGRDARERFLQVHADIVRQRLQRGDVDHARLVRQRGAVREAIAHEFVDGGEKRGQCLPGAGRRGDERRAACADQRPGARLRAGRGGKGVTEPVDYGGMKARERVGEWRIDGHRLILGAE